MPWNVTCRVKELEPCPNGPSPAVIRLMSTEADEKERQRVFELVTEDLRKEIPALLTDIHQLSLRVPINETGAITVTMARVASLLGKLFLEADKQTAKNLEMQREMLRWTRNVF